MNPKRDTPPKKQVVCPFCGYAMPIFYESTAMAKGLWIRCKGRSCKKDFEIKTPETK